MQSFRALVERHFRVYDERNETYQGEVLASMYYVMFNAETGPDDAFDALQQDLSSSHPDLLVFMRRDGGEDIIFIAERPPVQESRVWLNWALMALTFLTTAMAGAGLWKGFSDPSAASSWRTYFDLEYLLWGSLSFGLPLMAILGLHEMGHYLAARKHKLRTSLPFFIPVPPTIMPFGTFGALIRIKDPMPNRKVLFDVGVAGPIAGFVVAVPFLLLGAAFTDASAYEVPDYAEFAATGPITELSYELGQATYAGSGGGLHVVQFSAAKELPYTATLFINDTFQETQSGTIDGVTNVPLTLPADVANWTLTVTWEDGFISFGDPLIVTLLGPLMPGDYLSHPMFIAAWVGMLITGLNLLPIGQLDGGHIARAVFGAKAVWVNRAAMLFLMYLVFAFSSWLFLVLFVFFTGMYHQPPLSDHKPLDRKRLSIAALSLVILVLTFVMVPLQL